MTESVPSGDILVSLSAEAVEAITVVAKLIPRTEAAYEAASLALWGAMAMGVHREPLPGLAVVTRDNRYLCYACYNEDDTATLCHFVPDDTPGNYPIVCETCGVILTGGR